MRMIRAAVVFLALLALTAQSFGQGVPASPPKPASPVSPPEKIAPPQKVKAHDAKLQHVTGTLVSVDSGGRALAIRDHEKEMKLAVDSKAVRDQLKLVKIGEQVRVDYVDENGEFVVRSVIRSSS